MFLKNWHVHIKKTDYSQAIPLCSLSQVLSLLEGGTWLILTFYICSQNFCLFSSFWLLFKVLVFSFFLQPLTLINVQLIKNKSTKPLKWVCKFKNKTWEMRWWLNYKIFVTKCEDLEFISLKWRPMPNIQGIQYWCIYESGGTHRPVTLTSWMSSRFSNFLSMSIWVLTNNSLIGECISTNIEGGNCKKYTCKMWRRDSYVINMIIIHVYSYDIVKNS